MVSCTRKRKICFFWSTAVIIASEMCIFFFLLLYYNHGQNVPLEDPSGTSARISANGNGKPSVRSGWLNILPSTSKQLLVDFSNYSLYIAKMNAIVTDYSSSKTKICRKPPKLDLGSCDMQSLYGLRDGALCVVARLDETKDWFPDDFLQTDWLPNYSNKSLSISCAIVAQNASVHRKGKLDIMYYEQQLQSIWPASGFSKEYFPLSDAPSNCYPPVTIKVDDSFVLDYDHDYVKITCSVWTNNWKKLVSSSSYINVTILNRAQREQIARKPFVLPELHIKETDHVTSVKPKSTMITTASNIIHTSSINSVSSERNGFIPITVTKNTTTATSTMNQESTKNQDGLPTAIPSSPTVTDFLTNDETAAIFTPETTPTTLATDATSISATDASPTVLVTQEQISRTNVSMTSLEFSSTATEHYNSTSTTFIEPSKSAVSTVAREQISSTSLDTDTTVAQSYTSDFTITVGTTDNDDPTVKSADEESVTYSGVPFVGFVEGNEAGAESNSYE